MILPTKTGGKDVSNIVFKQKSQRKKKQQNGQSKRTKGQPTIYKLKDRVTRTPLKTEGELMLFLIIM
jgi:hypothetical protein